MGIFRVLRALWHGQNDAWSVLRQWDLPISLWYIVNHAGVDVENGRQGLTGHTVRHTRHSTVNRPVKWCADICGTVRGTRVRNTWAKFKTQCGLSHCHGPLSNKIK